GPALANLTSELPDGVSYHGGLEDGHGDRLGDFPDRTVHGDRRPVPGAARCYRGAAPRPRPGPERQRGADASDLRRVGAVGLRACLLALRPPTPPVSL